MRNLISFSGMACGAIAGLLVVGIYYHDQNSKVAAASNLQTGPDTIPYNSPEVSTAADYHQVFKAFKPNYQHSIDDMHQERELLEFQLKADEIIAKALLTAEARGIGMVDLMAQQQLSSSPSEAQLQRIKQKVVDIEQGLEGLNEKI